MNYLSDFVTILIQRPFPPFTPATPHHFINRTHSRPEHKREIITKLPPIRGCKNIIPAAEAETLVKEIFLCGGNNPINTLSPIMLWKAGSSEI